MAVRALRSDPRGFQPAFALILDTIVVFILALYGILMATPLLGPVPRLGTVLPLLLGGVLVVARSVFPRLRPNVAVGIRTPWTLGDRQVWDRVHRAWATRWAAIGLRAGTRLPGRRLPRLADDNARPPPRVLKRRHPVGRSGFTVAA